MISNSNCIGCQACADLCPQKAISFQYDEWGQGRAAVHIERCNNCGLCETYCPSINNMFHPAQEHVYAAVSTKNHHMGSSGSVFYELAARFIKDGGVVFGAAFDTDLKLVHKKASSVSELASLCKSKYLHSDMSGIYNEISNCLKKGQKIMFVGTPCQVSAVKNAFIKKYENQLFLIDFLCHGTGTQKCFDMCIKAEEKNKNGKILDFTFRAKSRKAEHSFQYRIKCNNREKNISGYAFEFPYYNSYLKYNIFNEYCYQCNYTKHERVGDITLGDFWGIQKYDQRLKDRNGVSMISVNSPKAQNALECVRNDCYIQEYPIEHASDNNQSFRECVDERCRNSKGELVSLLMTKGEAALVNAMSCADIRKKYIYAKTPSFIKNTWGYVKRLLRSVVKK